MDIFENKKVTVDSLTSHLKIEDKEAFTLYLKELWVDLFSRVKENKNDKKEIEVKLTGVTKLIFDKYFSLPGIIGDRFFRVLDSKNTGFLSLSDFIKGMTILFCGGYEETIKFIFNFYDMDNDGIIDKEDIRVVLSYITLDDSPDIKSTGINITYSKRIKSQEELYIILQKCFENIPNNKMNFATFKNIIENVNSDIYLMIYIFLLENKPFTKENIKSYQNKKSKGKDNNNQTSSEINLIMSPSKNSNFSPYKAFLRGRVRRTTVVNKEVDISKILKNTNENSNTKKGSLPNIGKKEVTDFKRKGRKRRTVQYESNIINLKDIQDEEKKNKIKEGRVKDLTRKRKQNQDLSEEQMQIKPAFKQRIKKNGEKSNSKNKKKNEEEDKDTSLSFDKESDESDDNSDDDDEEEEEEDEDEILKYEGILYKLVDGKMRELYFKLVHKDLYFFKNKNDSQHKGMHNLSGLFLQKEKSVNYDGVNYHSFSVVYPTKTRIYYCKSEKEYNEWFEKLKIATGYTNLLDIYEVKNKLGSGKFGLVKLGIDKKTGQKVAIKIMKKSSMDSSDLELVRTEIEILKICQHPNIIRLYNVFENADYMYIIMEYCSGGDLFSYLENRNFRLSEKRASTIIHKMSTAVYYMHSFGVAHRDLKPENVLMTSDDEDGDIRILDFGLSKILGPYEKCDEPYGTLTYCAPEIIIDEPYSKAVDLWSLGIMTYLMVTGKLPFNSEDENEIARQVVYDDPDYSRNPIWKSITYECKDFIKRLLEKDQNKRMTIKQLLEHKWIKMYDTNKYTERRKSNSEGGKDFELYSSTKKLDEVQ
jgi:serine/threonine protein kinase